MALISSRPLSFTLLVIAIVLIPRSTSPAPTYRAHGCSNTTMFTNNTQFQSNLNTVFQSLYSNSTNPTGFYLTSANNTVYGLFLCRGDVNATVCQDCVTTATTTDLPTTYCPNRKVAVIWYDECMVRYSNESIFHRMEEYPSRPLRHKYNITGNITLFTEELTSMMNDVMVNAAKGGSQKKFATDVKNLSSLPTLYGLGQCTPDLRGTECAECLSYAIKLLPLSGGGRMLLPSCNVRYEFYAFFIGAANLLLSPPPSPPIRTDSTGTGLVSGKRRVTYKTLIIIAVAFVFFLLLAILCFCISKRRVRKNPKGSKSHDQMKCVDTLLCEFDDIKLATDNFSDVNRLTKGISGEVYKGIHPSGQEIVVKKICRKGRNGELEFNNEVQLLANLQHKNLVKLVGFCIRKDSGFLMYEFQPNGSLDQFLYDPIKRTQLDWETRHKIILGTARALLYLHEDSQLMIIHRDLKASNILLGAEMSPKISNFSKAIMVHTDQTIGGTSTIKGTYGYMPLEYMLQGHFSIKSDVFSFGVLLLEIISGESISSFSDAECQDLLSFAWRKWSEDEALQVVDQTIQGIEIHTAQILRCIEIALLCVQEDPTCRPTTSTVVFMLNSNTISKAEPSRPASVIWPQ